MAVCAMCGKRQSVEMKFQLAEGQNICDACKKNFDDLKSENDLVFKNAFDEIKRKHYWAANDVSEKLEPILERYAKRAEAIENGIAYDMKTEQEALRRETQKEAYGATAGPNTKQTTVEGYQASAEQGNQRMVSVNRGIQVGESIREWARILAVLGYVGTAFAVLGMLWLDGIMAAFTTGAICVLSVGSMHAILKGFGEIIIQLSEINQKLSRK